MSKLSEEFAKPSLDGLRIGLLTALLVVNAIMQNLPHDPTELVSDRQIAFLCPRRETTRRYRSRNMLPLDFTAAFAAWFKMRLMNRLPFSGGRTFWKRRRIRKRRAACP